MSEERLILLLLFNALAFGINAANFVDLKGWRRMISGACAFVIVGLTAKALIEWAQ